MTPFKTVRNWLYEQKVCQRQGNPQGRVEPKSVCKVILQGFYTVELGGGRVRVSTEVCVSRGLVLAAGMTRFP